jgi:predicted RNA-binding protein with RPS1 domain
MIKNYHGFVFRDNETFGLLHIDHIRPLNDIKEIAKLESGWVAAGVCKCVLCE